MDNFESYKDVRTIASVSALIAVATTSIYFQNKISKIEADLKEIQKHLATIVPYVDPSSKQQLDQVVKAIRVLDSRVASTQSDLKTIAHTPHNHKQSPRKYERLTKSSHNRHSEKGISFKPNEYDDDGEDDNSYDFDGDIAAML